jgi:hypothetical protein
VESTQADSQQGFRDVGPHCRELDPSIHTLNELRMRFLPRALGKECNSAQHLDFSHTVSTTYLQSVGWEMDVVLSR